MVRAWQIDRLINAARSYGALHGIRMSTVSKRLFNDGKVLARLERGCAITTRRHNAAMATLTRHPGVVSDFPPPKGTGAGPFARDLQQEC